MKESIREMTNDERMDKLVDHGQYALIDCINWLCERVDYLEDVIRKDREYHAKNNQQTPTG